MEMEYKDPSKRGRWIVLAGVVLAVAAGGAAFFVINQAQQQAGQAGLQMVPVVVATRDLAPRTPIEAADVTVRQIPVDASNGQGVVADPNAVVGRLLAVPVLTGQMVTVNLLASSSAGGQFSILEPGETVAPDSEAWRAVSITVPDDRAVGGLVNAGMTVDVLVTAQVNVPQDVLDDGRYYTDKSTKIVYQDMVVLAKSASFYIMRTSMPVAEEISHLQASGTAQFSLILRPEADNRVSDASSLGATTNRIITRYGLPIPENYPAGNAPIVTPPPLASLTPTPSAWPSASNPAAGSAAAGSAAAASPAPSASASPAQ